MHLVSSSRATPSPLFPSLMQVLLCTASCLAGAALILLASPWSNVVAGSSTGQPLPQTALLDFTATWCGPCQQMSPIIDRLGQQGFPVRKVDVDQERHLAERFAVKAMPTFILIVNGQEVMRQTGATSEAQLRRMLQQIPQWERELASSKPAKTRETKAPSTDELLGASPFAVELGSPQSSLPDAFAENGAFDRARRALQQPFRRKDAPKEAVAEVSHDSKIIRGQSNDAESATPLSLAMQVSTRLRVKDKSGLNYGSGTIVDSRVGRTLIVTCGHIFRNLGSEGVIEVDVFGPNRQPTTFIGQVVKVDLKGDVGLVAIPTPKALPSVLLNQADTGLNSGDKLISIGCGGGELPTQEAVTVTAVNKYDGPDNIECTGLPVQGRSGGGLFQGTRLVGICIAADPKDRRGVYTALMPVHELIAASGYAALLPRKATDEAVAQAPGNRVEAGSTIAATAAAAASADAMLRDALAASATPASFVKTDTRSVDPSSTASQLQDALSQSPDAEVICIVRPKNSSAASRVVIIHSATPKLVSYLLDSTGGKSGMPQETLVRSPATPAAIGAPATIETSMTEQLSSVHPGSADPFAPSTPPKRPSSPR